VAQAFVLLWTLQRACDVQLATLSMGRAIPISPEVAARCAQDALQFHPAHGAGQDVFDAMVRLALRQDAGFQA
jgi:ribulose-5-phosphate 4-epimerase/fuculose-1-phosphate aldolase